MIKSPVYLAVVISLNIFAQDSLEERLEEKKEQSQQLWENINKQVRDVFTVINDDASITYYHPNRTDTVKVRGKKKQQHLLFSDISDPDQVCKYLAKDYSNSSNEIKSVNKFSKFTWTITDPYSFDYYTSINDAGSLQNFYKTDNRRFQRLTCHVFNGNPPISSRYKKITYKDDNLAEISYPKFRINRTVRHFSSKNNFNSICKLFGFSSVESKEIKKTSSWLRRNPVTLNQDIKFEELQTTKSYLKSITCRY
jgi:hypothetical protein